MNEYIKTRYRKAAPRIVKALKNHHFDAYYADTKAEAVQQLLELIPADHVVGWGGSLTLKECGAIDAVRAHYTCLDRDSVSTPEEKAEIMRRALTCDTFLMSSNAISEDGQLVNIDGTGNRVAALIFGPKSVVVIAGMNKVVKSVEDAIHRTQTLVAPANVQRFSDYLTPCYADGTCHNCFTEPCICAHVVNTRISRPANRIKVILVGEELGI